MARLRRGGANYRIQSVDEELGNILLRNSYVCMSAGHQIVGGVEFKIEMSVSGLALNALCCRSKAEIRYFSGTQPILSLVT
jgi:hypothetical protein